tara:strand:- start:493 stop:939 length:447 start_codon:yes stop_codon:yes gene_type:complete
MSFEVRLEPAICQKLSADTDISNMVLRRISPVALDQDLGLPAIMYEITGSNPSRNLTSRNNLIQADVDIYCIAETYSDATKLGEYVRREMSASRGDVSVTDDGTPIQVKILGITHTDDRIEYSPPVDGGRTGVYTRRFSFLISFRPED